ncbi:protein accumulation and replication of chloroplasts 3 [Quercus suber]|uniref:Protein accumulation and replication of chloroplasts 3 n=1 Tax=Quercus suber TaxID=58331 RepID=A0AAW0LUM4_QUESU
MEKDALWRRWWMPNMGPYGVCLWKALGRVDVFRGCVSFKTAKTEGVDQIAGIPLPRRFSMVDPIIGCPSFYYPTLFSLEAFVEVEGTNKAPVQARLKHVQQTLSEEKIQAGTVKNFVEFPNDNSRTQVADFETQAGSFPQSAVGGGEDVDTDMLLRKDLVTLDEAVKTANNAVLLAINAISVLISVSYFSLERHRKFIDVSHGDVKEVQVSELTKILQSYNEAKIGFGAGYNAKTSILQSLYDCPFLGVGVKDLNGMVICILASSDTVNNSDIHAFLCTFRQITEYTQSIILSVTHEPNLEPNLLVTTVLIVGDTGQQSSQKNSSILSTLAQHFPFVFDLLRKHHPQFSDIQGKHLHVNASCEGINSGLTHERGNGIDENGTAEDLQTVLSRDDNELYASRNYNSESEQSEVGLAETSTKSFRFYNAITEGTPAFQREPLVSWNLGPAYQIAEEWAKERATDTGTAPIIDDLSIFHLPVGVRPSDELRDNVNISLTTQNPNPETDDDVKARPTVYPSVSSWSALTDAGFEVVKDFYNSAFTLFNGKYVDVPKKQGVVSVRAASMLEAERDSPKKWSPIVEIQYRGGIYRGRCQGGLPEGKGRLVLGDRSIYDGTWRYGKKSGPGTFYFSNGDVFQGSWREDVMHGKGWFYFHTGDRWFANFWKGKANGEGRFYSKSGDVFFGHFQDGWRHGHFLCIDVNGTRSLEIWDQGVLVSCKQLDSDTDVK